MFGDLAFLKENNDILHKDINSFTIPEDLERVFSILIWYFDIIVLKKGISRVGSGKFCSDGGIT